MKKKTAPNGSADMKDEIKIEVTDKRKTQIEPSPS
jgi:hypothetical protein